MNFNTLFCIIFIEQIGSSLSSSQTTGEPWPMPMSYQTTDDTQSISASFRFTVSGQDCDILEAAIYRYYRILFSKSRDTRLKFFAGNTNELTSVDINLMTSCETYPSLQMDESYTLSISTGKGNLTSSSIWGILRGLETFSQIVFESEDGGYLVKNTMIKDAPRFSHRGVLLDTSRHFLPKDVILQNLDGMAYNKLNVFHWHIVDDQSFPYQSVMFPDLSEKGAYDPQTHVYTQEDIKDIIEYARLRGIRVIPEFDSPGHSQSWGLSQKELLTKCYSAGKPSGSYGPINPVANTTYTFLKTFMKELTTVFQDKYLHLGGDEVSFSCWESNPDVTAFMQKMGYGKDYGKLEQYYMQNLLDIVGSYNSGYIIWQEVVDNGAKVNPDTVVEIWKKGYQDELSKVTKLGYKTMLSACWYLNKISYGADWVEYYKCDPHHFEGTAEQKALVMGGELCMWGEYVDSTNVISRTWPRGSSVAERLWSPENVSDANAARPRLEEHRCRLISDQNSSESLTAVTNCGSGTSVYIYVCDCKRQPGRCCNPWITETLPLVKVQPDTVVHVWKGGYQAELQRVTALGHRALLSSPWYLDYISYGADWKRYYQIEPLDFNATESQKKLLMGGEACLWAEYVDATNVVSRLWPRASAVAERLWSPMSVKDVNAATMRIEEHRCRMVSRGIHAEPPNGPGFCKHEAGAWSKK